MSENNIDLLFISLAVLIFNLPFGYWRAHVKKFSLQWILAIHLPVPFVVALRIYTDIGFEFITYPILVTAFFAGQYLGKKIYAYRKVNSSFPLSACLTYDTYRKN